MTGYMKLYRSLLENPLFDNSDLLKVWIWCLLKASYQQHFEMVGKQKIELLPGQFVFGRKKAAAELKLGESQFYRLMKHLEGENQIVLKSNNKYTLVNVINWEFYQGLEMQVEQQMNNKRTTNEQQMNTIEERKEIYKENNNNNISSSCITRVRACEQISNDDVIAMEELQNLPLEAQLRFDDIAEELIKKYFQKECTVSDKAKMYWWLELLSSKPQMTDSDLDLLRTAFEIADESDGMNFKYIDGIFNNWVDNEIRTISDYRIHEIRRRK